jgi:uncharacterized repeat protein (TIGR01451 family)
MFTSMRRRVLLSLALVALAAAAVFAVAPAPTASPAINVTLNGSVSRDGQSLPLEQAGSVRPGEIITWNISVANKGQGTARSLHVVGDVDDGTSLVPGSATGEGVSGVMYSTEHPHDQQTFFERPTVRELVGGEVRERPARPDEIKAVQLTFAQVAAGETLKATYRTRVR